MEKSLKTAIIVIAILILILCICIIIIKITENHKQEQKEQQESEMIEKVKVGEIQIENATHKYLYCNDIIEDLFDYISEKQERVKNSEALISLLDEDYINEKNITQDNVLSILKDYKNITSYFTKEIYKQEILEKQGINGNYLYIKGIIRKDSKEQFIYMLIKEDFINNTYSMSIITEEEFNLKGKENQEIKIASNSYNKIKNKSFSDYNICKEYLNDYLNTVKTNIENGYAILDTEYKTKRFGSIERYSEYINSIKDRLSSTILKSYSIEREEGYIQYICVDQFGNYYIFTNEKVMNYTVILDTYTINLPPFTQKYNESNTMQKVGFNVQKCIEALNNKDYSYVYNKLDEEFKSNNYQTEEIFIKNIKENLFDNNIIESYSRLNEGNNYIYQIAIKDANHEENTKNMTIIMQIKEGTDFVMSFSFEE